MGLLPSHLGGHVHVRRHLWPVPYTVPAVRALPADDRHLGSEGRFGHAKTHLQGRGGGGAMNLELLKDKLGIGDDKLYGAIGAFSEPDDLVAAGRKIREMGYTKLDAM